MPAVFLGALVAGAASVAVTALTAGIAAVTLATFAIPAAISLGVGLLARAFAPKIPSLTAPDRGTITRTINETISPARWIIGRVRAEGRLVWAHEDEDDLHLAYVLSEGECEEIEEIWADGEKLPVVKTVESGHNVFTVADKFVCHEYFKADGTQGAESFAAATGANLAWSAASVKGKGLSWVYVKLTQNDYGDDLDSRQWNRVPSLEFIMKGIKISNGRNPSGAKRHTDNAAVVRKWWLTERRGVDWRRINGTYYTAARSRCATMIDISTLTGFDSSEMQGDLTRYTINGIIHSGDDVTRIEEDMDFAWDGSVVDWDGEFLFRPGGDRSSVHEIVGADIVEEPIYKPGTTLNSNRYVCDIPQSEWHDMLPYTLRVDDSGKQTYDGVVQTLNLGTTEFVTNPAQASNLLRSAARRARASSSIELTLMPGEDFEHSTIIPGDKVTLQLPELGIADQDFFVLNSKVLPGWAIQISITEWGSDWYNDDISLEHFSPREVSQIAVLTAPDPVTVLITPKYNDDNTVVWYAYLSMPKSPYSYAIRYRHSSNTTSWQEATTHASSTVLTLGEAGTWTFEVRRISPDGRSSPTTTVTGEAEFDIVVPGAPTLARKEFNGSLARFVFTGLERYVQGVEIAYTFEALSSSASPGAIAEAGWEAATKLGTYTFLPARTTTEERAVIDNMPAVGKYNLYARAVDIAGQLSPLTHLGAYTYLVAPPTGTSVTEYGDGTRAYLFTLPPDPGVVGVEIRYREVLGGATLADTPEGDESAPVARRIFSSGDGSVITIEYNEPIANIVPATSAFTLTVGGSAATVSSVSISNSLVKLTVGTAITNTQAVTLAYTAPSSNPIQDEAGNEAGSFAATSVVNQVGVDAAAPEWNSMEKLHEGAIAVSPYLAKFPTAGRWTFGFRSRSNGGDLSRIVYFQATLRNPFSVDIADAVRAAIEDNPSLVNLDAEIDKANDAADRAVAAAEEAEAAEIAAEAAQTAAEIAETAAEQAETNVDEAKKAIDNSKTSVDAALEATKSARDAATAAATEAEEEALKAGTSATNADGSATAAAGSATTATEQATASETSAMSSATQAMAAAASATLAGNSASAASSSAMTASAQATEAGTQAEAARTERTTAETEAGKAATSATNAAASETNADGSAKAAAVSLTSVTAEVGKAATSASAAATSASAAAASESAAGTSASASETSATKAATEAGKAATSASNASTSETNADGSATSAAASLSSVTAEVGKAATEAGKAATSASAAATSAAAALASENAAGTSATSAATQATNAATQAGNAATSATQASNSATAADGSATAAASSASGVSAFATTAQTEAGKAATEAGKAAGSASAAATSAQTAQTAASSVGTSASAAQGSATTAATEAGKASAAATRAASSASEADGSAKAAASSASGISAHATNAANSATAAGNSATAAAGSQRTAAASATAAGQSAKTAETHATSAQTRAATAGTAANNASSSESAADGSAKAAASSAQAAAAQATNAASSATAAASSAQTASAANTNLQQQVSAAQTAQTAAETAKASAETAATNASTSETNASGSASAAATSATNAAASATGAADAVAGIDATVTASIDTALATEFASAIVMRAETGDGASSSSLELASLTNLSGSRSTAKLRAENVELVAGDSSLKVTDGKLALNVKSGGGVTVDSSGVSFDGASVPRVWTRLRSTALQTETTWTNTGITLATAQTYRWLAFMREGVPASMIQTTALGISNRAMRHLGITASPATVSSTVRANSGNVQVRANSTADRMSITEIWGVST